MTFKKIAATSSLALLTVMPAFAQSTRDLDYRFDGGFQPAATALDSVAAPRLSFGRSQPIVPALGFQSNRQTWNTVLLVSAIVGGVGLLQGETTLIILGAAGVILSMTQMNKYGFQPTFARQGLTFHGAGPVSFGLNPFAGLSKKPTASPAASAFVQATFRF